MAGTDGGTESFLVRAAKSVAVWLFWLCGG